MEERVSKLAARAIKEETKRLKGLDGQAIGDVNFYTTQILSGNGYFQKYLFQTDKCEHLTCIYGYAAQDYAEHAFFQYNA